MEDIKNIEPLKLPELDASQVILDNSLCQLNKMAYSDGLHQYHLNWISPPTNSHYRAVLKLTLNESLFYLHFNQPMLSAMCQQWIDFEALCQLPEKLLDATLAAATAPMLEAFSKQTGYHMGFVSSRLIDNNTEHFAKDFDEHLVVHFAASVDHIKDTLFFSFSPSLLNHAIEIISQFNNYRSPTPGLIPVPCMFELARIELSMSEVADLSRGDILLLPLPQHNTFDNVTLRLPSSASFAAKVEQRNVTVLHELGETMSDQTDVQAKTNDLSDIPLSVSFDVAEQSITLSELQQMRPGYTFMLDCDMKNLLKMRINGKLMGVCELVQVGDRVGARIIKVDEQDAASLEQTESQVVEEDTAFDSAVEAG
ncbi:FliM/FliN family flagellar motor switch protein [Pleionea sp. CnH1-48]|uniref:FliM/FliN family flagellar motor switch protein n=1 Tax=Pleionea sp. CnH1-48 TaxID=2954494 RepID=UPI0020983CD9|nr:FliM/FliN family flagellar motor switch protein [Pleionea sp. CnH1-48]MCO7226991.1 FliM/FliN family flagellar motor switch protein [Pleionea sp. CnH1-48]